MAVRTTAHLRNLRSPRGHPTLRRHGQWRRCVRRADSRTAVRRHSRSLTAAYRHLSIPQSALSNEGYPPCAGPYRSIEAAIAAYTCAGLEGATISIIGGIVMPMLALISSFVALRLMHRDYRLLRSADRLR